MYYVIYQDVQVANGENIKILDGSLLVLDEGGSITGGFSPGNWDSFYLDED